MKSEKPASNDQKEIPEAIINGSCSTWQSMAAAEREKAIQYMRKETLLSESSTYLLEWMLRSKELAVAEEQKINQLISAAREKLLSKIIEAEKKEFSTQKPILSPIPVKARTQKDTVPPGEIAERFLAQGIDIERLQRAWQSFYRVNGYAAIMGPQYELKIPSLTEDVMNRLEKALKEKTIDYVMIDDARLNDSMMFQLLQPATPVHQTKLFHQTRHLGPQSLAAIMNISYLLRQKVTMEQDPEARKKLKKKFGRRELELSQDSFYNDYETKREVRLIGLKTQPGIIAEPGPNAELERTMDHLEKPYSTVMNIGTFLRLAHFMRTENPLALCKLSTGMNASGELTDLYFFMNNFLTDGQIAIARHVLSQDGTIIESKNRENFFSGTEDMSYIPIIQSDLPAPESEKNIISRRTEIARTS